MEITIFTIFSSLTDKLGITQDWLNAMGMNILTVVAIVRGRFPAIDSFWEQSAVVGAAALLLALAQFYTNPWAIAASVILLWAGTTLTTKTGEKGVSATTNRFRGGTE
jgi:chromate transport protein ChrA